MKGILGIKRGMTQVFGTNGKLVPVTVVEVEPNVISQIKTKENDGYDAIQLAAVSKKETRSNKPEIGHLKKANATPKRFLRELRGVDVSAYSLGQEIKADIFMRPAPVMDFPQGNSRNLLRIIFYFTTQVNALVVILLVFAVILLKKKSGQF